MSACLAPQPPASPPPKPTAAVASDKPDPSCGCDETEQREDALTVPWYGFAPASKKTAVLQLEKSPTSPPKFTVRDAKADKEILSGTATPWGSLFCGKCERHYFTLDLSPVTTEGDLVVEAAGIRSHPFAVRRSAYVRALTPQGEMTLQTIFTSFLAQQRCIAEKCIKKACGPMQDPAPGAHCEDDSKGLPVYRSVRAQPEEFEEMKPPIASGDVGGGYHDATSTDKETTDVARMLRDLAWAAGTAPSRADRARIVGEIRWAADWMLKMQRPEGWFFIGVKPHMWQTWSKEHLPRRVVAVEDTGTTAACAAALAAAANAVRATDKDVSAKYLAAADRAFGWVKTHPESFTDKYPGWWTGSPGNVLGASVELAIAHDEKKGGVHYDDAASRIANGAWSPSGCWTGKGNKIPGELGWQVSELLSAGTAMELARFGRHAKDDGARSLELARQWRDHWTQQIDSPWGVPLVLHKVDYWGTMQYQLELAKNLLVMGETTGDATSTEAGERVLGYVAGNNAWGLSFIVGLGEWKKPLALFERPYEGSRGGIVPGVMDRDKDGIPAIVSNNPWRQQDPWELFELATEHGGSLALCVSLLDRRYGG